MFSQYYIFVWCYTFSMLVFNHMLAGSIVALTVPGPLVPVVAFSSHYLLDMTPHGYGEEPPFSRRLKIQFAADAVVSVITLVFLLCFFPMAQWPAIGIGVFFGVLPDALWAFWRKGPKWLDRILDFSHWIQWGERTYGWIFEAFYGFLFVFTLFALTGRA